MQYFYEILDHFNNLYNKKILLSEDDKPKKRASVKVWRTLQNTIAAQYGPNTYNTETSKDKLKQTLLGAGFSQNQINGIISGQLAGPSKKEARVIEAEGETQKEKEPAEPQSQEPEQVQPTLTPEQQELAVELQNLSLSLTDLGNESSIQDLNEKQVQELLAFIKSKGGDVKNPQTLLQAFLLKYVKGPNSLPVRVQQATYFSPIDEAALTPEQQLIAKTSITKAISDLTNFIKEYQGKELTKAEFDEFQEKANLFYSRIRINNPELGDDRRKIIIYSEDGQYAGSFGDTGSVAALISILKSKLKFAFTSAEDPNGEKFELKRTEKLDDVVSNALGKSFETLVHSTISIQSAVRQRNAACKTKTPLSKNECQKFEQIVKESFEKYKAVLVENKQYFLSLAELAKTDAVGKAKDIEALVQLSEDFLELTEGDKLKDTFRVLTYLIGNNPIFSNATKSELVASVVGLGRKADIRLIYDTEEAAQKASAFAGQQYIKLDDGTFALDLSLKVNVSERPQLKLSTTGYGIATQLCLAMAGKSDLSSVREKEAAEVFMNTLRSLFSDSIIDPTDPIEVNKRMQKAYEDRAKHKQALLTVMGSSPETSVVRKNGKSVVSDTMKPIIDMLGGVLKKTGVDVLSHEEINVLFSEDGTVDPVALKKLRDKLGEQNLLLGEEGKSFLRLAKKLSSMKNPIGKSYTDSKREELIRQRKETMIEMMSLLDGMATKKKLDLPVGSPDREKAIDKIVADLHIHGAASIEDLAITEVGIRNGESNTFSHNQLINRFSRLLREGKATLSHNGNGYSLRYLNELGKEEILRVSTDVTSKGIQGKVIVNDQGKKGSYNKDTTITTKTESFTNYDKKLKLIEQIIENQKQLLLKLIDEPKVISGD